MNLPEFLWIFFLFTLCTHCGVEFIDEHTDSSETSLVCLLLAHPAIMAPLQSKEMKFGANYMAAPMTTMANADHDHKMGIVPTAPCAEIDLDMSAAAGGLNMMAHSAAPMMDGRQRLPANHKRTRRRSNAICASLSVVLVIFCCVITGLEVSTNE